MSGVASIIKQSHYERPSTLTQKLSQLTKPTTEMHNAHADFIVGGMELQKHVYTESEKCKNPNSSAFYLRARKMLNATLKRISTNFHSQPSHKRFLHLLFISLN